MQLDITEGTAEQAHQVSLLIPEFDPPKYGLSEYQKRTIGVPNLILIAYHDGQPVGFKVGYQRNNDASFYSWMGGVVPAHRRRKVAEQLAQYQEHWARTQGYQKITFKTMNRNLAMLIFALKNGYKITEVAPQENIDDYRIWLEKIIAL